MALPPLPQFVALFYKAKTKEFLFRKLSGRLFAVSLIFQNVLLLGANASVMGSRTVGQEGTRRGAAAWAVGNHHTWHSLGKATISHALSEVRDGVAMLRHNNLQHTDSYGLNTSITWRSVFFTHFLLKHRRETNEMNKQQLSPRKQLKTNCA